MKYRNKVFIATSLDGYIADKNGSIEWLHSIPNPDNNDMGYQNFISGVDAIVMGRSTFEVVCGFDIDWPYTIPVFVLSNNILSIPVELKDKVSLVNGKLSDILDKIHHLGYNNLYIDGGKTIQGFLEEDLIDELTITIIPWLLGEGIPLFAVMPQRLFFECTETNIFLGQVVQNHYVRKR